MDYKGQLLAMIDRLVSGEWSVPEFEKQYYFFYLDQVPDDALPDDRDFAFFAMVQEKLDWTDGAPDAQSRRDGWLNHEEYRCWVTEELHRYRTGQVPGWTVK
jgi:hypothetical protein